MTFQSILAAFLVIATGCSTVVAQPTTLPQDAFKGAMHSAAVLSGGGAAINTQFGVYLSTSEHMDHWKAIAGDHEGNFWRCVGGTASQVYFERLMENEEKLTKENAFIVGDKGTPIALEVWTAAGGVRHIGTFPERTEFMFVSDSIGWRKGPSELSVTTDGCKTWEEIVVTFPDGKPAEKNAEVLFEAQWVSATELVVSAEAIKVGKSAIALFEVPAVGKPKQRWVGDANHFWARFCAASDETGVWVRTDKTHVLNVADGKELASYDDNNLQRGSVIRGHRIYCLRDDGLFIGDFDDKSISKVTKLMLRGGVLLTVPLNDGSTQVVAQDGKIYRWKPSDSKPETIALQVDNSVVREALKPTPDEPTEDEIKEYGRAIQGLPPQTLQKLSDEMDSHPEWTIRQRVQSVLQQWHKFKASPPTSLPRSPGDPTESEAKEWRDIIMRLPPKIQNDLAKEIEKHPNWTRRQMVQRVIQEWHSINLSESEQKEYDEALRGLTPEIGKSLAKEMDQHPEWTARQEIEKVIEEWHKCKATHPSTTQPATLERPALSPLAPL